MTLPGWFAGIIRCIWSVIATAGPSGWSLTRRGGSRVHECMSPQVQQCLLIRHDISHGMIHKWTRTRKYPSVRWYTVYCGKNIVACFEGDLWGRGENRIKNKMWAVQARSTSRRFPTGLTPSLTTILDIYNSGMSVTISFRQDLLYTFISDIIEIFRSVGTKTLVHTVSASSLNTFWPAYTWVRY